MNKEYEVVIGGEKFKATLKSGFEEVQINPDYWDFEQTLMTMPSLEDEVHDEKDYLVSNISFERHQTGEFIAAYMALSINVPSGNHRELTTLSLDLHSAFDKVFEKTWKKIS